MADTIFDAADRPRVAHEGSLVSLEYGELRWSFDLALVPGATAEAIDGVHPQIRISGGRWRGTDFGCDLTLTASRGDSEWWVDIYLPKLAPNSSQRLQLTSWLRGEPAALKIDPKRFAFTSLGNPSRKIAASGSSLVAEITCTNRWIFTGGFALSDPALNFRRFEIGVTDDGDVGVEASEASGTASAHIGTLKGGRQLTAQGNPEGWALLAKPQETWSVVVYGKAALTTDGPTPLMLFAENVYIADVERGVTAEGASATTSPTDPRPKDGLGALDSGALARLRTLSQRPTPSVEKVRLLQGSFAAETSGLTLAGHTAVLRGERDFEIVFGGNQPSWSFEATLHAIDTSVKGADRARIAFPEARAIKIYVSPAPANPGAEYLDLNRRTLRVELAGSRLEVRRFRDLLNLEVELDNYGLAIDERGRRLKPGNDWDGKPDVQVNFYLSAQHVAERAFPRQLGGESAPTETPFDALVEGRPAQPSRLAFAIPEARANDDWFDLARLLDWTDLEQETHFTARTYHLETEEHVRRYLTYPSPEEAERVQLLRAAQDWLRKPVGWGSPGRAHLPTAIEMPYRLWLSPSQKARWQVSRPPDPKDSVHRLWSASLSLADGADSVRAIWSRGLRDSFLETREPYSHTDASAWPRDEGEFRIPFPAKHRRELVLLTAGRLLPALKRLDKDGKSDPSGSVEALKGSYKALQPDEGIYNPRPFRRAEMRLTTLGGTLLLEGEWSPPSPASTDQYTPNWSGLRVSRTSHEIYMGRTIESEAAIKGYLFPLGHRASFVTRHERLYFKHPQSPEPVSYLIERKFIEIGDAEKVFPALGQPFAGRLLGDTRRITLLGRQTPDLFDPEHPKLPDLEPASLDKANRGKLALGSKLAFWPRLGAKRGTEHLFEFSIDDSPGAMRGPLMFLDNLVVHDPLAMRAVVEHYLGAGKWAPGAAKLEPLRRAKFHGDSLRYAPTPTGHADQAGALDATSAPEGAEGRTSLRTHGWMFGVTGRLGLAPDGVPVQGMAGIAPPDTPCELLTMDGMMEGADQPPFYPAIAAAEITVQSLERLTGAARKPVLVAPNHRYAMTGFDPAANPAELFLDLLSPDLDLSFAGAGGASGGLAHTDMKVVHLSRRIGPVGGSAIRRQRPAAAPAARLDRAVAAVPAAAATSPAEAGRLDPFDALPNAKLLGIVPLKLIVRAAAIGAAPKLVETVQSGAADIEDAANQAVAVARSMAQQVEATLAGLEEHLTKAATEILAGADWRSAYPELGQRLEQARTTLLEAAGVAAGEIFEFIGRFQATLRGLAEELARVARDPVPAAIKAVIPEIAAQWKALRTIAEALPGGAAGQLKALAAQLEADLTPLKPGNVAKILFGLDNPDLDFSLAKADQLVAELHKSVLHEVIGQPFADLVGTYQEATRRLQSAESEGLDWLLSLVDRTLGFAVAIGGMTEAAKLEASIQGQCQRIGDALVAIADGLAAKGTVLDGHLLAAQTALAEMSGRIGPEGLNVSFAQSRDRALQIVDALLSGLRAIGRERSGLAKALSATCDFGRLDGVARIMRLRSEAVGRARDLALELGGLIDLLAEARSAPASDFEKTKKSLSAAIGELAALLKGLTSVGAIGQAGEQALAKHVNALAVSWQTNGLVAQAEQLRQAVNEINARGRQAAATLDAALAATRTAIAKAERDPGLLLAAAGHFGEIATQVDRRAAGLVAAGSRLAQDQIAVLEDWAYGGLAEAANTAVTLYAIGERALEKVDGALKLPAFKRSLEILLRPEVLAGLAKNRQAVIAEAAELRQIAADSSSPARRPAARATAAKLVQRWRGTGTGSTQPALVTAARDLARLGQTLVSGQIAQLIDVRGIERTLRDELARLVPVKTTVSYNWTTQLGPFPSGGKPIFEMIASKANDLTLEAEIKVDLLGGGRRSMRGQGILQPFRVHLLGGFPLVSIEFSEARFSLDGGARFDVAVTNVEIKESLNFIKALQSFMSGGGATGPFWSIRPPLIEVGYRFSSDQIVLGSLMFLNIALEASAELALDGRDARFRFRLSSPERPLLISNPPYGGGGYALIVANARGIVAFEASFEFGAVTQVKFGPLSAHGRVTAGIYISQSVEQGAVIAGFVNAVGEGRIACFSVSVNIQVRLEHRGSDSSMVGTSTYKVSFRVGFAKISYKFTARYTFSGKKKQALALAGTSALVPVYTNRPRQTELWRAYAAQFDLDLLDS